MKIPLESADERKNCLAQNAENTKKRREAMKQAQAVTPELHLAEQNWTHTDITELVLKMVGLDNIKRKTCSLGSKEKIILYSNSKDATIPAHAKKLEG